MQGIDWNTLLGKLIDQAPAIIGALFTGLAVLLGAIGTLFSIIIYRKQVKATVERSQLSDKMDSYYEEVNGQSKELKNLIYTSSKAEGALEQKEISEEKARILAEKVSDDKNVPKS